MTTGMHGAWLEAGELATLPDGGASIPCAVLQQRRLRRHDYCLPAARFDHAPPSETLWVRGLALIGNELHISNFHHFNRDSLFFARSISRLGENASSRISQIVIVDGSDVNGWSTNHARAMLGTLLSRTVFQPKSSGKALQQNKRDLSTATLLPASPSSSSSSGFFRNVFASNNPSPAAPKYVCYESALEKLVTWPADRDDLAFVRQRAYEYCGVATAAEKKPARASDCTKSLFSRCERLLVLILRGFPPDSPSTARQIANPSDVQKALGEYARTIGLTLHVTSFSGMTYCEQVRLVSAARILVGVHGQGITNGQFMADDGLVVELFHGGSRPYWTKFDNVGHQPLFLSGGRPYVAAPYAESSCSMMQWKHTPSCKSHINATRLVGLVAAAMEAVAPPHAKVE